MILTSRALRSTTVSSAALIRSTILPEPEPEPRSPAPSIILKIFMSSMFKHPVPCSRNVMLRSLADSTIRLPSVAKILGLEIVSYGK